MLGNHQVNLISAVLQNIPHMYVGIVLALVWPNVGKKHLPLFREAENNTIFFI